MKLFRGFRRRRIEQTMSKQGGTYGPPRSRCPWCKEFATEGEPHRCPSTGKTETHTNPAAPKDDQK